MKDQNCRREGGQAIVEFAFIMVPFFLLFLLVVDGGLFFSSYVTATSSVREGARCAVVGGSNANVKALVEGQLPGSGGTATVTRSGGIGGDAVVSAAWSYEWLTPVDLFGLPSVLSRNSSSTMRLETTDVNKTC